MLGAVLGVCDSDGGTRAACVSLTGELLGLGEVGPPCRGAVAPERIAGSIIAAVGLATGEDAPTVPAEALCAGIAGAEREDAREVLLAALGEANLARDVTVTTDAAVAFVGAHGLQAGVLVVADTHAIVVGGRESETGLIMSSADGWGPLLGDEGSAVWIGLQGVRAAMRHMDGRGPATSLTELTLDALGVQSACELAESVTLEWESRQRILQVTPLCFEAAEMGDDVAQGIVHEAAKALAGATAAVLSRLDEDAETPVALTGSVFSYQPLHEEFERHLAVVAPGVLVRDPLLPPEMGAALMALTRYFPYGDVPCGVQDLVETMTREYRQVKSMLDNGRTTQ